MMMLCNNTIHYSLYCYSFHIMLYWPLMTNLPGDDFSRRGKRASEAGALTDPNGRDFGMGARTYFIQYHLHVQVRQPRQKAQAQCICIYVDKRADTPASQENPPTSLAIFSLRENGPEREYGEGSRYCSKGIVHCVCVCIYIYMRYIISYYTAAGRLSLRGAARRGHQGRHPHRRHALLQV
jgi:hypothetical protein